MTFRATQTHARRPSRRRARWVALGGAALLSGFSGACAAPLDLDGYPPHRILTCREIAQVPLASRKWNLFDGRVLLRLPAGARQVGPHEWLSSSETADITFDSISIRVSETFRWVGPSLEADVVEDASRLDQAMRVVPLPTHGTPVVEVAATNVLPPAPTELDREATVRFDFIARALVAHPDGTALEVYVDTWPGVLGNDLASCTAFATRLFESIEAGPRRLDLAGGRRREPGFTRGDEIVFDVPAGFVVVHGERSIAMTKVVPVGSAPTSLVLYYPGAPGDQYLPDGPVPPYGESLEWSGPCELRANQHGPNDVSIEAPRHDPWDVRQLNATISLFAPDVPTCEELKRVARTIRVETKGKRGR